VVVGVVELSDLARTRELVEGALFEADRERLHPLAAFERGKRRERSRVDAARKQHADRYVGEQMRPHRVSQARAQLLRQLVLVLGSHFPGRNGGGPRVALQSRLAAFPDEQMAGRKLLRPLPDRKRRRDRVEGEESFKGVEVDLAAGESLQLRREGERAALGRVVQRLDPEGVTGEHEPPALRVPERDSEHSAQLADVVRSVFLVEVQVDLGVARRAEAVPAPFEGRPQLEVVVDLAVLDDLDRAVLVPDGLVAAGEVDDGKPARRQSDRAVDERARAVRAAVAQRLVHGLERPRVDGASVERGESADPAHGP
jgi:hypothetical protein